ALQQAIADYSLNVKHLLDLINGVERDLYQGRYETFENLKLYCHGVASTVGLTCLSIFRLDEPSHREFAEKLGLAVQMTNILRDVKSDAARNRIYLPKEDLKRFGYSENDLLKSVYNDHFVRLMNFEAKRTRELYAAAWQALPPISRRAARPA